MPIGYHTMLPLFSIRKTSFQASSVKSHALHTTCVFNPILFYVHGGVCCLLTAKKLVWFPWRSGTPGGGCRDLVSLEGSPSASALQDGALRGVCSAKLPTFTFRAGTVPPQGEPRSEPPALLLKGGFLPLPRSLWGHSKAVVSDTEATSLPDPSSRAGFPSHLTECFVACSVPLQPGQCCPCPHPGGVGSQVWQ